MLDGYDIYYSQAKPFSSGRSFFFHACVHFGSGTSQYVSRLGSGAFLEVRSDQRFFNWSPTLCEGYGLRFSDDRPLGVCQSKIVCKRLVRKYIHIEVGPKLGWMYGMWYTYVNISVEITSAKIKTRACWTNTNTHTHMLDGWVECWAHPLRSVRSRPCTWFFWSATANISLYLYHFGGFWVVYVVCTKTWYFMWCLECFSVEQNASQFIVFRIDTNEPDHSFHNVNVK